MIAATAEDLSDGCNSYGCNSNGCNSIPASAKRWSMFRRWCIHPFGTTRLGPLCNSSGVVLLQPSGGDQLGFGRQLDGPWSSARQCSFHHIRIFCFLTPQRCRRCHPHCLIFQFLQAEATNPLTPGCRPGDEKDATPSWKQLYNSPNNWILRFDASVQARCPGT